MRAATIIRIAVIVVLLLWPFVAPNPFMITLVMLIAMSAIGATSLHLIVRSGHVSLAHAAFMGVGCYTSVYVTMQLAWPFPFNVLAGAATPALLALLIGPVLLRLQGKYFVLVTFLLGEIIRLGFVRAEDLTGGANGIFGIPPPAALFASDLGLYYLVVGTSIACVLLVARVLNCGIGRSIDSIREGERLAECSGVPVLLIKVGLFVLSCALVGLQGSLVAFRLHYVDPGAFTSVQSLGFVVINVIGGMERLMGPLIGSVFMVVMPELLRGYVELQQILFGVILIFVIAAIPGGIVQLLDRLRLPTRRRVALPHSEVTMAPP